MSVRRPEDIDLSLEFTPNPNTLKYVVADILLEKGVANFLDAQAASDSPLAAKIFTTEGVAAVMVGRNFITVTKDDAKEWDQIHSQTESIIKGHLASGENVISKDASTKITGGHKTTSSSEADSVESQIIRILDEEIRPAVAMDGGDITFDRYENGVVYLFMQGSCAGCPSSTMTLKMGIETRLKELIPEIKEVEAI